MNEHQLRCFLAVAQHCNFSKAAKELFLTQPSLSYQISHLEKELGVQLFQRTTTKVSLTEAGRVFEPYARQICACYTESQRALQPYTTQEKVLTLVCPSVMIRRAPIYREIVQQATRCFPGYQLQVCTAGPGQKPEELFDPEADCQIMMEMDPLPPGYRSDVLFRTYGYVVAGPGHRLYAQKSVQPEQLQGEILYYDTESRIFAEKVGHMLQEKGLKVQLQAVISYDHMYPMLVAGKGLYLSPHPYPAGPTEHYLRIEGLELLPTVLISHAHPEKPAAAQLAALIRQLYAEAQEQNKIL